MTDKLRSSSSPSPSSMCITHNKQKPKGVTNQENILARTNFSNIDFLIINSNNSIEKNNQKAIHRKNINGSNIWKDVQSHS